jgi:DNA-binding NarL/FixJ family response regulator
VALRCLLVDDHEAFLTSAARLLQSQGLEVVGIASSGNEAVGLAVEFEPDVALVDVQLGAESGVEVARKLIREASGVRVILISTYAEEDLADLLKESRAVGFLAKSALNAEAVSALLG